MMNNMNEFCEPPIAPVYPNVPIDAAEQRQIVDLCNRFKKAVQAHAKEKKEVMRICYAYNKQKFQGNDLLPRPSTLGGERDANTGRPQVFMPVIRQEIKQLYATLKLTLFPNESDFFRVRGLNEQAALLEDELTEGLKHLFRQAQITEKIGRYLLDLVIAGNGAMMPLIKENIIWEWGYDPLSGQYVAYEKNDTPALDLERLNPLYFYLEPQAADPDKARWCYLDQKKVQEILDSPCYINREQMDAHRRNTLNQSPDNDSRGTWDLYHLDSTFNDIEAYVPYDLYYMPTLKTERCVYRNMIVGIADNDVLVRFHPNLYPKGLNPVVATTWMDDPDSPYGTGPAEDIKEFQRVLNILFNYMIETLARIGNRFVARPEADLSGLFGVAGGIATTENPADDIMPLTGDYTEPTFLLNLIGTMKADAQITVGSQNPFQGASSIDFKKTATELQILQENAVTVIREVIEHIAVMGVSRILERLMILAADLHNEPLEIRVDDPLQGTRFMRVDLTPLRSGQYNIELTNINPSQSRQQQISTLLTMLDKLELNPQLSQYLKNDGFELLKKILLIMGERDFNAYLKSPDELQAEAIRQMLDKKTATEENPNGTP